MDFGDYLLREGLIDTRQLRQVREHLALFQMPLGKLGVEEGVFTRKENIAVLLEKRKNPEQRYGEIAKRQGILDDDALQKLLRLQKMETTTLNDVLVELGLLPKKKMITERIKYERLKKNGMPDNAD